MMSLCCCVSPGIKFSQKRIDHGEHLLDLTLTVTKPFFAMDFNCLCLGKEMPTLFIYVIARN